MQYKQKHPAWAECFLLSLKKKSNQNRTEQNKICVYYTTAFGLAPKA